MMKKLTDRQQIAEIKRIVRKDATTSGELISHDSKRMCIIGGLAYYGIGISKRDLQNIDTFDAWTLVRKKFPIINKQRFKCIVTMNDQIENLAERRTALCTFFDSLLVKK